MHFANISLPESCILKAFAKLRRPETPKEPSLKCFVQRATIKRCFLSPAQTGKELKSNLLFLPKIDAAKKIQKGLTYFNISCLHPVKQRCKKHRSLCTGWLRSLTT